MHVVICPDAVEVSRQAGALVAAAVAGNPRLVLGLAAGATPVGLYRELVRYHEGGLDFAGVTAFGLDEYFGLAADHPARFRNAVQRDFLGGVNLPPDRVHWPEARPGRDIAAQCADYERSIAEAGGIDLQVLGIGVNGHLGFNEPGSSLAGRTRLVHLSAATRRINQGSFASPGEMPQAAITQGLGTILAARRIVLVATGEAKAQAVAGAVEGPLTAMLPASVLQMHPHVTMFLDAAAAGCLARRQDYDEEVAVLRQLGGLD